MHISSPEKLDKQHYYHLLPDSDLKNGGTRRSYGKGKGFIISEPPKHKSQQQGRFHFNKYALAAAILASTHSVLLGYGEPCFNQFQNEIWRNTYHTQQILVGSLNVFSLIGSLAYDKTSDTIGRRYTIVLAATTFFVGALLVGLAPFFPFLMAGRLVAGIGVGYSLMIGPVYTVEISPAMTRGFLSWLPEIFINIGILLGYISNFALSGLPQPLNWRLMLGLAALPASAVALGVIAMPESSRWLVMKGRFVEAKCVLIKTLDSKTEADMRLVEMEKPRVFKDAGIHDRRQQFGITIMMGIVKTCFVFISALYLDNFGRRPLLMLGTIGMAISLAGLGVGSNYLEQSYEKPVWAIALCIVAVCADFSFFSIGLGPIAWVYSSEIFPMRLRGQGSSLAISVNRIVSGIVSMTFLSISNKITFGGMFFALSGIMAAAAIFVYFFLPETKGKSLEEIETIFDS
ncbi:hypothetical protein CXB51_014844 [Gossypium anomalum]|uniref:Major facilitator superfamily (MFS) profile domain-containing protein n=1 Tax=Gossypium anomalum TaxID=47600 RepID=A0A8J6D549_9ROSI|nr:hypothetical protein CXB51_014844 [Gossypium anomalum]